MVPLFRHFGHLNYTIFRAELIATFFAFGRLRNGYRNISFRFFAFTFAFDQRICTLEVKSIDFYALIW